MTNTSAVKVFTAFGVSPELLAKAELWGLSYHPTPTGYGVYQNSVYLGSIPLKATAITLAMAGNLGNASKAAIAAVITVTLNKAVDAVKGASTDVGGGLLPGDIDPPNEMQVLIKEPPLVESMKKQLHAKPGVLTSDYAPEKPFVDLCPQDPPGKSSPVINLEPKANNIQPGVIALKDATALQQPVHGTSNGSVYYVSAVLDGLLCATRLKNGTLSIRVEGPKLKAYISKLEGLGFGVKGEYASAHLSVETDELARRTFGAVLFSIGAEYIIAWTSPTKNLGT